MSCPRDKRTTHRTLKIEQYRKLDGKPFSCWKNTLNNSKQVIHMDASDCVLSDCRDLTLLSDKYHL